VADRQVALPLGIARIGSHKPLSNVQAPAIGRQRLLLVSRPEQTADVIVADRKVALALEIGRVGGGERLSDCKTSPGRP
jgi:hypothetical protein